MSVAATTAAAKTKSIRRERKSIETEERAPKQEKEIAPFALCFTAVVEGRKAGSQKSRAHTQLISYSVQWRKKSKGILSPGQEGGGRNEYREPSKVIVAAADMAANGVPKVDSQQKVVSTTFDCSIKTGLKTGRKADKQTGREKHHPMILIAEREESKVKRRRRLLLNRAGHTFRSLARSPSCVCITVHKCTPFIPFDVVVVVVCSVSQPAMENGKHTMCD